MNWLDFVFTAKTGIPMRRWTITVFCTVAACLVCGMAAAAEPVANEMRSLVLVLGVSGEEEFGREFEDIAKSWMDGADRAGFEVQVIGTATNEAASDRDQLLELLARETAVLSGELWVVLVGHGTFDGKVAKFNLRGPDLSDEEFATALKNCRRQLAVINCASASGPFLKALSAPGRVVITATRSGYEVSRTRFGLHLARAVANPAADLDKDGQTSLLEAFLMASRQVEEFYREAGRLATEHSLLDDNGDGLGTPPDWYVGVRAVRKPEQGRTADGIRAHQMNFVRGEQEQQLSPEMRARRDVLERQLNEWRERKAGLKEDEYYGRLEEILTEIARLYQSS